MRATMDHPGYRHESDTSREAAETLTTAQVYRQALLDQLERRGMEGITIDEFAQAMSVPPNAVSGRFSELANVDKICKTPMRRKTRSGKNACVYLLGKWTDHMVPAAEPTPAEKLRDLKTKLAMTGHGHVIPRNDGKREGCGGTYSCRVCKQEKAYLEMMEGKV